MASERRNPGVTATVYNIGFELQRAQKIANMNKKSREIIYPEENYYGWAINAKVEDLKLLAAGQWRGRTVSTTSLDQAADAAMARQQGTVAPSVDDGAGPALNLFDFLKR